MQATDATPAEREISFSVSVIEHRMLLDQLIRFMLLVLPVLADLFFSIEWIPDRMAAPAISIFIYSVVSDFQKQYVFRVVLLPKAGQVEFYVKYPLGKVVRKTLTFDQARLDIYTRRSKGRRLIYQMDFMRGKKEIASLTRQKRGFSSEELYMLMRNAEQAGIPCRYLK